MGGGHSSVTTIRRSLSVPGADSESYTTTLKSGSAQSTSAHGSSFSQHGKMIRLDHKQVEAEGNSSDSATKQEIFPKMLYALIENEPNSTIEWTNEGKTFAVRDNGELEKVGITGSVSLYLFLLLPLSLPSPLLVWLQSANSHSYSLFVLLLRAFFSSSSPGFVLLFCVSCRCSQKLKLMNGSRFVLMCLDACCTLSRSSKITSGTQSTRRFKDSSTCTVFLKSSRALTRGASTASISIGA